MLTGRESLIRLVGKRRRFLPNRESIVSTPISSFLNLLKVDTLGADASAEEASPRLSSGGNGGSASGNSTTALDAPHLDYVTCPICGTRVPGDDFTINSHLDVCTTRGAKRKLTQRTLLQLNFCTRTRDHCQKGDHSEINVDENEPKKELLPRFVQESTVKDPAKYRNSDLPCSCFDLIRKTDFCGFLTCSCGNNSKIDVGTAGDMPLDMSNISRCVLQTFIVGRKYSDIDDIMVGAAVALQRDPCNVKDPNAIKVTFVDAGQTKLLGFIQRGLALYLSPLLDQYNLRFEGYVTSSSTNSQNVIPIQVVCDCASSIDNTFNSLWDNVLRTAESLNSDPPSTVKYQNNFSLVVKDCLSNNSHLLTDAERIFLESFMTLSDDSQRLFVRLYMRKGPWFRVSNISYAEISDYESAVKELLGAGFILSFHPACYLHDGEMQELLNILTVSELREISLSLQKNCSRVRRKQEFVAALISSYQDGTGVLLPSMVRDRAGSCIRISSLAESLVWRAQRLFFLNGEQDFSTFLLVDLGLIKYPTYNCIITKPIFASRGEFLAFEEAIEVAQIMDESLEENNDNLVLRCMEMSDSRISSFSANTERSSLTLFSLFSASLVYSKVVLLGVSYLEREHRYNGAIIFLKRLLDAFACDRRRGYWTLRLSIDLEHLNSPDESLSVAEAGLLDPWIRAGSRTALERRVLRLAKPPRRWKVPKLSDSIKRKIKEIQIHGRPLSCKIGTKSRFYGEDGEQCGVEQLALQYYGGEGGGWQGVHSESGIWLTIFGLLMWDILFSDVPDVFRSGFQTAPLDLATDCFYITRRSIIESQLRKIEDGMGEEIIITAWESHMGTACKGVNWERNSLPELRAAVTCIGGPCLALLCRNLAQDYRSWSSGMPDLLLWRFLGDYRGEAKLVEVKGPRDRLSEQQRAWLLFLLGCGFSVEICKVVPLPDST